MKANLLLEDGTILHGKGLGARTEAIGEIVFNTCHTGYEEVLSDPSYLGQMVLFTASHIGNTGITLEDLESGRMQAESLICKEISRFVDNHRARMSLEEYLLRQNRVAIHQIDTRFVTQKIRSAGSMRAIVSAVDSDVESLKQKLRAIRSFASVNPVARVSTRYPYVTGNPDSKFKVAVLDFGIKKGILDSLKDVDICCHVFPWNTKASEIEAIQPNGLFLSNGPGDPAWLHENTSVTAEIRRLMYRYPTFGICLGHQLIALALGGRTSKLKFGHHAANHPVAEKESWTAGVSPVQITSQNHNFVVEAESVAAQFHITHIHLNDLSVAGMRHHTMPIQSVQFHPESNPGPVDSKHLFEQFKRMMETTVCRATAT